jgi:hypothetical protein
MQDGTTPSDDAATPLDLDLNPEVRLWMYGECPVQAEGAIGGEPFYFRSRGNRWSLEVGTRDGDGEPAFRYEEPYGDEPYVAGWIWHHEALALLARGFAVYHQWGRIGRTDRLAATRAAKDSNACHSDESSVTTDP